MWKHHRVFFFLLIYARAMLAEQVKCPAIADSWVEAPPWNATGRESRNHGSDEQLVINGRNSFALFAFDMAPAKGMRIEKATLRVRRQSNPVPLTMVGVSTISGGAWNEGEVNYFSARTGQPWSYVGSDLTDVVFGIGGSLYTYVHARDTGEGWYEIDVSPEMATALAIGDQFGLMLSDEKGQTRTRHLLSSRETLDPPTLILEGARGEIPLPGRVRALVPKSVTALGRSSVRSGSVILRFGGANAAGYELAYSPSPIRSFSSALVVPRWMLDPLAPNPGPLVTRNGIHDEVNAIVEQLQPGRLYYFAARGFGLNGQPGPVSSLGRFRASSRAWPSLPAAPPMATPVPGPSGTVPIRIWAFSELHKVNPQTGVLLEKGPIWTGDVKLAGARNEFVGFQLAIESQAPVKDIAVTVEEPLFASYNLPPVFQKSGAMRIFREWMVPDDKDTSNTRAWYPDPLIPLHHAFDLPAQDNGVPRQRVQPLFVDIYIPHDAKVGLHRGSISVRVAGQLLRKIGVTVEVLSLSLPDELNFIVDLNAYGGVNAGYGISRGTPEYHRLLQAYHRVAHLHRANLDILGYSHSGSTEPDQAPPLAGEGVETKVADWSAWDAHFGPLLSGSAFSDLPRAAVPVPIIYLALFENWPGDLSKNYRWNIAERVQTAADYQRLITRHALESGPIQEGFPRQYQDRFSAVARQFAEHIREHKWTKTKYQIFFNDKYYYKDPTRGSGNGVSWWLFDEPNHRDDYRAISFFGWLGKRWLKDYPDVPMVFRADISYVDFIRDQLAGQIDIDCTSQHFWTKNRYLMDNRNRFGRTYWNYASTNHPRDTNVAMRAWCWRAWAAGVDGIVPWNTVRGMEAWERAEPLTVFYAGKKFGLNEPLDCLRLKAFRRGEQDAEYLTLLAHKKGWDREAVARALAAALDLPVETRRQYEEDAGSIRFDQVTDAQLDQLRLRVVAALLSR